MLSPFASMPSPTYCKPVKEIEVDDCISQNSVDQSMTSLSSAASQLPADPRPDPTITREMEDWKTNGLVSDDQLAKYDTFIYPPTPSPQPLMSLPESSIVILNTLSQFS